jgi:hypothetical protein
MTPAQSSTRPALPAFGKLAVSAVLANAPLLMWALITRHGRPALSIVAGVVFGLAVYGALHLFVGRGLDPFVQNLRGKANAKTGGATAVFALLLPLKYVVLGGLLWLLWRTGELNLLWFAVAFLIVQLSVTLTAVAHLTRHPRV